MWDMSILQVVPGLRLAAPRDASRLRELLREAVQVGDAPTVVRFPKGPPSGDIDAVDRVGGCDVLVRNGTKDVLIVGVGAMAATSVEVAERLVAQGIGVTVVDPRWVKPVDPALIDLAREHRLVVSVEDNGVVGGCGSVLLSTLAEARVETPVRVHGIPQRFLEHAKRGVILERVGLTAQTLARSIVEDITALDDGQPLSTEPDSGPVGVTGPDCQARSVNYDVERVRACFPALADGTAYFDGPGGSQTPRQVADAVAATLSSRHLQPGHRDRVRAARVRGRRGAPAPRWPTCSGATRGAWCSAAR